MNSMEDSFNRKRKPNQPAQQELKIEQEQPVYFPVDVVVFVSMLPSSVRFTCLPHSTMECLLKLPTLEMIFSTNRLDGYFQEKMSSNLKYDNLKSESFENILNSSREELSYDSNSSNGEGGLSVTCSMTDFSLKFYNRLAIRNQIDPRFFYAEQSMYTEDKDSLSVRVAYIKVNISRTRRVSRAIEHAKFKNGTSSLNDVKLSVLADIGSSSFTYDMRNIKEVFVFPKIWYRRSLARRLFLGEESSISMNPSASKNTANGAFNPNFEYKETKSKSSEVVKRPRTLEIVPAESRIG